jgi:uncharacterized membrane protein
MQLGFQHLHSYFAYLVLALLVITVIVALLNVVGKKTFGSLGKLSKFSLIATHSQFLIGAILYIISGRYQDMGAKMGIATERLLALEHPLMMLLGIVLITIGNSKAKKATTDAQKNKSILIFFGLGLILILSRIPWSNWF